MEEETPICPKCNKNLCYWNAKKQWWEFCKECQASSISCDDINRLKKAYGIPEAYLNASLDMFRPDVVEAIRANSNNFHKNIMLTGESFVGKTTFLAAIVNSIVEQYKFKSPNILFVNVFELMETIKNKTLYFDSLDSCKKCDILVFDDIVSSYTDNEYKFLYSVLNHRNNEMKTTHSSTNSSEMESRLKSRLIRDGGLEITLSMKSRNNMFGA